MYKVEINGRLSQWTVTEIVKAKELIATYKRQDKKDKRVGQSYKIVKVD